MVKITFLGSCREVGRSAILIESKSGAKCMLDYGIRLSGEERLPIHSELNNLKAIALTHAHIDHSGAIPALYTNGAIPFYTTAVSLSITEILLRDTLRISSYPYPFGQREISAMMRSAKFIPKKTTQKIAEKFYLTFYPAGHIPGSVSILVEVDGKKILYTGDINTQETALVNKADTSGIPDIDALIIESTYALREHPPRKELEIEFLKNIMTIIDNGGNVLIPAFGVARSQEALLILDKHNFKGRIFVDGMAREISQLLKHYPESIKSIDSYQSALRKAHFISKKRSRRDRMNAKRRKGVFIAPSGMMKGGTVIDYAKSFLRDQNSAVYLVGYQVDDSPGRMLLDEGIFKFHEFSRRTGNEIDINIEAACDVEYFDFSSHADNHSLHEYVSSLDFSEDSDYIFCVHGDNKSTTTLSRELIKKNFNSVAPETGESYRI